MKTLSLIFPLACRNLLRNRRRTALTIAAIALAVASMASLGAFMRAWNYSSFETTIENLTGHGQIHAAGYTEDPVVEYSMAPLGAKAHSILNGSDVAAWAPRVRVPAMIRSERESFPVYLLGIEPSRESNLSFIATAISEGRYLADENDMGILVGERLAERLKTQLNHRVVLLAQGVNGDIREMGFRVVGLFSADLAMENGVVFIGRARSQSLLELENRISEVSFKAHPLSRLPELVQALRQAEPNRDTQSWDELQPFAKAMMEMNENSIEIWILVAFGVVSFGLVNSLLMAVHERIREFGLLQALGMKPRWLLVQMLLESTFLVAIGNLIGLAVGSAIVWHYRGGVSLGIGAEYFGASQALYPQIDVAELFLIGGSVTVLGFLASLYPAFQATRIMPVDVLNRATN